MGVGFNCGEIMLNHCPSQSRFLKLTFSLLAVLPYQSVVFSLCLLKVLNITLNVVSKGEMKMMSWR